MGFEEDRFLCTVQDAQKCSLCHNVLDNPLVTPCGKVFCSGCVLPPVIQENKCPADDCSELVTASHLKNDLDRRSDILKMKLKCEFWSRGCSQVVVLGDMHIHMRGCDYRPIQCRNKGCTRVVPNMDLIQHENSSCEFRPVGICQNGCNLLLLCKDVASHNCNEALRSHLNGQDHKIAALESHLQRMSVRYHRREKSLLAQISGLHEEIQIQALRFQKRASSYAAQVDDLLSQKALLDNRQTCEEVTEKITLERDQGSLGFNIMGGYTDDGMSEGVIVSRIQDTGPGARQGMKLHDKIVQVNGQDLSKSSHEEAVEAFHNAKEPIVVEVLRKVNKEPKMRTKLSPVSMVSTATQTTTDDYTENTFFNMFNPPSPPLFCPNGSLVQPSCRQGVAFSTIDDGGLTDLELANGLQYAGGSYEEEDKPYDMEYEEVTLQRVSSADKVGLTLCYGSTEEEITDIFISEIEPDSIAANDGRIREGDQILQINGVDVQSRDAAIKSFAENRSDITLLLARPQVVQIDDGFLDGQSPLDDLDAMLGGPHHGLGMDFRTSLLDQTIDEEEGGTTDTATTENSTKHEKDSGVGRTDDSTRNDESSEQELLENDCTSPGSSDPNYPRTGLGNTDLHLSNDSFTSNDTHDHECGANEIAAEECDKFREVLETRCVEEIAATAAVCRKGSEGSLEHEIALLNKEMETIRFECQQIIDSHGKDQQQVRLATEVKPETFRSPRMVPKMGTRLDYMKQLHATQEGATDTWLRHDQAFLNQVNNELSPSDVVDKDTSGTSAYNTGDSCRSTPLTLELHSGDSSKGHKTSMLCLAAPLPKKPAHSDSEKHSQSSCFNKEWSSDGDARRNGNVSHVVSHTASHGGVSQVSQTEGDKVESLHELYTQYADVMYTNQANLQHTMMVQQKLFQQQLSQRDQAPMSSTATPMQLSSPQSPLSPPHTPTHNTLHLQSKLQAPPQHMSLHQVAPQHQDANGNNSMNSCSVPMEWVVKRRPDGSRYITRRPIRSKLLKERAKKVAEERCGMTTDDDAVSEMKVGRYWSKEDRKRHVDKAREQRKRKELLIKSKEKGGEEKKEMNIVELSQRKMMRHKERKVLDNFTTIQEMMAHGSRDTQGKTYNPLLSVTTV